VNFLLFGGTGSLGNALTEQLLLSGHKVFVFARGEDKHHKIKIKFPDVQCIVGDIRNYDSVWSAIKYTKPDIIINCAALKQVPLAEDFPEEAVATNIDGTINLMKAVQNYERQRLHVLGISTDKVCMPVNSYGMSKALQERIHLRAQDKTRHIHNCVRYGNVLSSTGSVIPVFKQRIENYQNLSITHKDMTRFFLSLQEAVELIMSALTDVGGQKIFVPKVKSAYIKDLAECLIDNKYSSLIPSEDRIQLEYTGIRPGEKLHELMISSEELSRTQKMNNCYVIHDIKKSVSFNQIEKEYSSGDPDNIMSKEVLWTFLKEKGIVSDND
jgi:UDP-glucose 4-epimerase